MLEWVGSLKVREKSSRRLVLGLAPVTSSAGVLVAAVGLYLTVQAWPASRILTAAALGVTALGILMMSVRRSLEFDREAGVLRVNQRALFLGNEFVVPLFHLRAVVVSRNPETHVGAPKYVAYLDRRVGDAIFLDEAKRCATLMSMAESIAEIADLRLEYNANVSAVSNDG